MFKAQLLRRNFSLFNRIPHSRIIRSAARDGHESVTIQRVRIQKPFFSKSRLVGAVAIGIATYALGRYIGIEVEVEVVEDERHKSTRPGDRGRTQDEQEDTEEDVEEEYDDEEDDEDEEYDDALLFLPTGLSRPKPKQYYRGSDPEWQEFVRLATDRPRVEKIRGELVALIRDLAHKNPSYIARLGTIDTSRGKMWIEIKFPDGPPVEYERPGVELTEDLEWRRATRPVEDVHHQRLRKILYPAEASNALYQDTKRKAGLSWKSFKEYVGWEEKSEPDTVQSVVQRVLATPPFPNGTAAPAGTVAPTSTSSSGTAERQPQADSASQIGAAARELGFVLPDPKKLTLDLSKFRQDFRKSFKPYPLQPPRGSFLVLGLVEVYGERARMTLNVAAAYDPKQGRYVNFKADLWNLVEHRQHPRGGP